MNRMVRMVRVAARSERNATEEEVAGEMRHAAAVLSRWCECPTCRAIAARLREVAARE